MFSSDPDESHKIKVYCEWIMCQLFLCCCDTLTESNFKKKARVYFDLQICLEVESITAEDADSQN